MTAAVLWLLGGLALLVAEVLAPGVFMMWLGLAALGTGALVYAADPSFGMPVSYTHLTLPTKRIV